MSRYEKAMLLSTKLVAADTYELVIESKCAKKHAIPGQFVHIQVPNRPDLLLRRPISINSIDTRNSTISLIVQVKNEGTRVLCNLSPHSILDIVGPVGKGFFLKKDTKRVAVLGGGIGVAPLRYLMEMHENVEFHSFLGFRNKKYVYQSEIFNRLSNLYTHTDDGSMGTKGFATDTLDKMLESQKFDAVYACGPNPMFKALKDVMEKYPDVDCYISMEERMGCGIGGCKVCVCKTIDQGEENYKAVCQDGPVFDIRKVVL